MSKPILCIDFDGVIHSYTTKWSDAVTISDPPVPGAFDWLESLTPHFQINIYSSRSKVEGAIHAMYDWFMKHGASILLMASLEFPHQKPAAFLTIDDRAICFSGEFPSIKEMQDFKPWNKSDRATELEWLRYFYQNVDFGPAHEDVIDAYKENFGYKNLPLGYENEY